MRGRFVLTPVVIACAIALVSAAPAQDASKRLQPTGVATAASTLRTPEQMDAFEAVNVAPTPRAEHFEPTMDIDTYRSLKQQAKLAPRPTKDAPRSGPLAPPVTGSMFAGPSECAGTAGCWFPPDVAASSGTDGQIIAVHNSMFSVYNNSGSQLTLKSLNSFFGYSTQPFYDPRVLYDSVWSRWCVTSPAFPESATVQYYGVACSVNGNALGGWHVYLINEAGLDGQGSGGIYDFPSVGDSQDAIVFTANIFTSTSYLGAFLWEASKAALFNGRGFSYHYWTGLQGTLQPARELIDGNGYAWFAAANSANGSTGNIAMYALGYPASFPDNSLSGPYNVAVPAYSVPPSAAQPSPCNVATDDLDTSDARFVQMGIQNGDLYYQVHSVSFGTANPRYYIIKGLLSFAPTVQETGIFYSTGTSSDFNASIAADGGNRMVMNWTSVDTIDSSYYPSVRFTGKLPTDGIISGDGIGTTLYTSPACMSGNYQASFGDQRWGDYSQSSSDPATSGQFWIDNEIVPSTSDWGTMIGRIHF